MSGTPSGALKAIREGIVEKQVKKLFVARYDDPKIIISYRPLTQDEWNKAFEILADPNLKDSERGQASRDANADLLIKSCIGIELRGTEINDKLNGFNPSLGDLLGIPTELSEARKVCQELFIADGDLVQHVNAVARWSGLVNSQAEEDLSGE